MTRVPRPSVSTDSFRYFHSVRPLIAYQVALSNILKPQSFSAPGSRLVPEKTGPLYDATARPQGDTRSMTNHEDSTKSTPSQDEASTLRRPLLLPRLAWLTRKPGRRSGKPRRWPKSAGTCGVGANSATFPGWCHSGAKHGARSRRNQHHHGQRGACR